MKIILNTLLFEATWTNHFPVLAIVIIALIFVSVQGFQIHGSALFSFFQGIKNLSLNKFCFFLFDCCSFE